MTVEECALYIEAQSIVLEDKFKEQAILLDGLSRQITSGFAEVMSSKRRHRRLALSQIYPSVFGRAKAIQSHQMSIQTQLQIWNNFLFGAKREG